MPESLFETYFEYTKDTEPSIFLHRWSLLCSVGAWLGRQYYFPFGDSKIIPNLYVMMVGDPGSRKSTAIKIAKRLMGAAGYESFAADKTTKEKFLLDLEGVEGDAGQQDGNKMMDELFGDGNVDRTPREVFIVADEFNEFMGSGNLEFLSMLGNFWDFDDDNTPYSYRLKNSRSVSIWNPTVSLLGGNTHDSFTACFPPQAMGQGFLSRLILVSAEASGKKITFPKKAPDELKVKIVEQLLEIKKKVQGEARLTNRASEMLDIIYRNYKGIDDLRFKHYCTRRFSQLIRLCLICSAARLSSEISAEDVLLANTILTYTEFKMPDAMGEYGKVKDSDVNNRIIALLNESSEPLEDAEIWRKGGISTDITSFEEFQKRLNGLTQAGKIQYVNGNKGVRGYLIHKKHLPETALYVDFKLLKEAEI